MLELYLNLMAVAVVFLHNTVPLNVLLAEP